jgi:hypothetical protein
MHPRASTWGSSPLGEVPFVAISLAIALTASSSAFRLHSETILDFTAAA